MFLESDADVRRAVFATYNSVKRANIKAGIPTLYITEKNGSEHQYTIGEIIMGRELPENMRKAYFEFSDSSVLSMDLIDGEHKFDNFLREDQESLTKVLKSADFKAPLPRRMPYKPAPVECMEVQPSKKPGMIVNLNGLGPGRAVSIPLDSKGEYAVIENLHELKLAPEKVHRKHEKGTEKIITERKPRPKRSVGYVKKGRPLVMTAEKVEGYVENLMRDNRDMAFADILERIEEDGYRIGGQKDFIYGKIFKTMRKMTNTMAKYNQPLCSKKD